MDEVKDAIVPVKDHADAIAATLGEMTASFRAMAVMLATTNERLAELEKEVRRLTKITPAQCKALNAEIRKRAVEVCAMHHAEGGEKSAAAAIRKALHNTCGINNNRELPRTDYNVAVRQVHIWDDYKIMQGIKARTQREKG